MAELVKKLKLPKPDGFLYFVEDDCSVWKHKGGHKELISKGSNKREKGYLYFRSKRLGEDLLAEFSSKS